MARPPRLVIPGLAHYVLLRGHNLQPVVVDEVDGHALLEALHEATRAQAVVVHAYAVLSSAVHLLLRPGSTEALSACMQNLGRRYVARFNRRHVRSGALWDSRFRAAALEPGGTTLAALRHIDTLGQGASAASRTGGPRDAMLVDPPEIWALGNTPFERELAYRELLAEELPAQTSIALDAALRGGRALGSERFLGQLATATGRQMLRRARGRPSAKRAA